MKQNWPVGETWRASFFLCALIVAAGGVAGADARAIVVEARTQDPARIDAWAGILKSGAAAERAAAAFALGQLGTAWEPVGDEARARAETALVTALPDEKDATARDRIVEALGKVGGTKAAAVLAAALDGKERVRAAVALAALAKNKVALDGATRGKLEKLLADKDAQARWAAALALVRMRDPASRPALRGCTKDSAANVRAACAKALADVGGQDDALALAPLLDDGDGRVAAEAARTLVKLASQCADSGCRALEAIENARVPWRPSVVQAVTFEHPRGMAAAAYLRVAYDAVPKADKLDERTRAILACKLAMAHDRALGQLELVPVCGDARVSERERGAWAAEALVGGGAPAAALLAKLAASPIAAVREAAAEGADAATVRKLLGDADAPVVAAAAERAEALKLTAAAPELRAALLRVHGADAVEAQQSLLGAAASLKLTALVPEVRALVDAEPYALRQAAAHALTALTGTPTVARAPSLPTEAPKLPPATVRLKTTRGTIVARLWVDDAPRTAGNFVALARKKFYDTLTFHRVVPDFVSQGGDPRGDGAGGPGYMIPCEIGMRRYGEGVMGMALSGRDTGGSQFFFTQAPEPHLDGRYTAFGEVVSGREVVDALVEGDVILELTVE